MPALGASAETLWEKEERTRLLSRLTGASLLLRDLSPLLLVSMCAAFGVELMAVVWALARTGAFLEFSVPTFIALTALFFFGYIALYMAVVYRHRGEIPMRIMRYVQATPAPVGELGHVRDALQDMVLASVIPAHPVLWMIESPGVNAMATSLGVRSTHVALTRGMVDHLNKAEIRAVLAHLIARVVSGDIERETIGAVAAGVGVGNRFFDTPLFPDDERLSPMNPRGYSKSSLRGGDVGAMFLLKDPSPLIASLEAIGRRDNLVGDWTECIGYLFVSWPYIDREIDSQGHDYDQRRIQELRTLYGVWPDGSTDGVNPTARR